jgi:hypothetical protein
VRAGGVQGGKIGRLGRQKERNLLILAKIVSKTLDKAKQSGTTGLLEVA